MGVLTGSHQLIETQGAITVAIKGTTTTNATNATSGEILAMAARFQDGDYRDIPDGHDRSEYQWNSFHEYGTVLDICQAADGTNIHILQHHRLSPPTTMLPEER